MLARTSVSAYTESTHADQGSIVAGLDLSNRDGIVSDAVAIIDVLCITLAALSVVHSGRAEAPSAAIAMSLGLTALAVAVVMPLRRLMRRLDPHADSWVIAVDMTARVVAFIALSAVLTGWHTLWLTPLVIAMSASWCLATRGLGFANERPNALRRGVMLVFAAIVTASCTTSVLSATEVSDAVITALSMGIAMFCSGAAASAAICALLARERAAISDTLRAVIQRERRERAHWLHDDVCTSLREVSLRLETRRLDAPSAAQIVADVEYRVRLRQLDDLVDIEHARIGEILQPFIRHAQQSDVRITEVPSYETSSMVLSERAARLMRHVLESLTERSLRNGAAELGFAVETTDKLLRLTITDDAPGEGLSDLLPTDTLRALMAALKPGGLTFSTTGSGGSAIIADVPVR